MRVSIGFDHGAVQLREPILAALAAKGHEVIDHGTRGMESVDYPDYAVAVAQDVAAGRADFGILSCTTGIGMSIAANKVPGARAALVAHEEDASITREHNDSNILVLAGRHTPADVARRMVDRFLSTPFSQGERHARRVAKIAAAERPAR